MDGACKAEAPQQTSQVVRECDLMSKAIVALDIALNTHSDKIAPILTENYSACESDSGEPDASTMVASHVQDMRRKIEAITQRIENLSERSEVYV
jgi:hypothetical protein